MLKNKLIEIKGHLITTEFKSGITSAERPYVFMGEYNLDD